MANSEFIVLKNAINCTSIKLDFRLENLFLSFQHGMFIMLYIVLQLRKSFNPNWHKCSFLASGPKVKTFLKTLWFYWIHLIIFVKLMSCLQILELGFWTYGWICLLGPSGPNLICRPHTPRSRHFFRFYDFIGFISSFLREWGPFCEYRS